MGGLLTIEKAVILSEAKDLFQDSSGFALRMTT